MRLIFASLLVPIVLSVAPAQSNDPVNVSFPRELGQGSVANPAWAPFYHGVASGDPLQDRVIIWTRVTPEAMPAQAVEVQWRVATDPELDNIVQSGDAVTDADRDYTVKIDVAGLESGTTYYYGFTHEGRNSLTGRTRTLPTGDVDHLRFAVVSCSNYQGGYYNAYRRLSERNDLDAVIHLGDYIYEYEQGGYGTEPLFAERPVEPETEILTLGEYRTRYSLYRLDTMLARVHQQHPFIVVWDDHESANDAWMGGAENHNEIISVDSVFDSGDMFVRLDTTFADEGEWIDRLAISKQVYFEWLPIRDNTDKGVYRSLNYGNLADLIMLDTRIHGREEQILNIYDPRLQSPDRTILGTDQKQWLKDQLEGSSAKWKLIGQQVTFSPFNIGWAGPANGASFEAAEALFLDFWDGYPAEREEIIDFIQSRDMDNVVILTGDVHASFAYDVTARPTALEFTSNDTTGLIETFSYTPSETYDPATGEGSVAVEFVCPSISSANFDENLGAEASFGLGLLINSPLGGFGNPNPHMKFKELDRHGYYILDVTEEGVQADFYYGDITQVSQQEAFFQGLRSDDGANHIRTAGGPAAPKSEQDEPAPLDPPGTSTSTTDVASAVTIVGVYPNPARDQSTLQLAIRQTGRIRVELSNAQGQFLRVLSDETMQAGVHQIRSDLSDLPDGAYVYTVKIGDSKQLARVVLKK